MLKLPVGEEQSGHVSCIYQFLIRIFEIHEKDVRQIWMFENCLKLGSLWMAKANLDRTGSSEYICAVKTFMQKSLENNLGKI